jgi:hypothetical protein
MRMVGRSRQLSGIFQGFFPALLPPALLSQVLWGLLNEMTKD